MSEYNYILVAESSSKQMNKEVDHDIAEYMAIKFINIMFEDIAILNNNQ